MTSPLGIDDRGTDDPEVNALRLQQQRNMLTTLLLAQGVPMLAHGDELSRTQRGNNNGYCQDNLITWVNWELDADQQALLDFTQRIVELRRDGPPLGEVFDAGRQLRPELEHHGCALLDRLASAHGVVQRAVHLETHGVDVAGEVRDLRRALRSDDAHFARARVSNRAREPFDRARHPTADEKRGCESRRERKTEHHPDRRVQLDPQIFETVLCRVQLCLLGVAQWSSRYERALVFDGVVTLRADAEHQRAAREDDDEVHE